MWKSKGGGRGWKGITTYSRGLLNVSSIAFREDTFFCSVWKAEKGKFDWEGNKFGGQFHFYYRTINRPQIKKILFRKPQECSSFGEKQIWKKVAIFRRPNKNYCKPLRLYLVIVGNVILYFIWLFWLKRFNEINFFSLSAKKL